LSIHHQLRKHGGKLVLCEVPAQPLQILERTGAVEEIGKENVYRDYKTAILSVNRQLLATTCGACKPGGTAKPTGVLQKATGAMARLTGSMMKPNLAKQTGAQAKPTVLRTSGPADCSLRCALVDESSPIGRQIEELDSKPKVAAGDASLEWLVPLPNAESI